MKQLLLRILRNVLPPFHPFKYWYIRYAWGEQETCWTKIEWAKRVEELEKLEELKQQGK